MPVYYSTDGTWWLSSDTASTTAPVYTPSWTTGATTTGSTMTYVPLGQTGSRFINRVIWCDHDYQSFIDDQQWIARNMQARQLEQIGHHSYIASRSPGRAVEDDLRHYYEQEQRRQRESIARQHALAASDRARELLLEHLTPAQRETFERNRWFIVEGGLSKQRYRIRDDGHMIANIDVLDGTIELGVKPKITHRLCGHCDIREVPLYDQLLAQKMMLECDEERFLRLANRHRAYG